MKDDHIYNRFQDSLAGKAQAAAEKIPTLDHGSKRGLHRTLASVQKAVFADRVTTLADAKARHQEIVDIAGVAADEDEKDEGVPKKSKKG